MHGHPAGDLGTLATVHASLSRLQDFVATSRPAVFRDTNHPAEWPAFTKWGGAEGVEHLKSLHGDTPVDVAVSACGIFSGDVRLAESTPKTFGQFLDTVYPINQEEASEAGPDWYLAQVPLLTAAPGAKAVLPGLANDIRIPPYLSAATGEGGGAHEAKVCSANLWMCRGSPVRSTRHYDGHHNLLCCLSGVKRIALFPPDHAPSLRRLHPVFAPGCNHCSASVEDTPGPGGVMLGGDDGPGEEVEIRRGDILFIPEGWFHQVESAPHTIAVNLWFPGEGWLAAGGAPGLGTECCVAVRGGGGEDCPGARNAPYLARRALEALVLRERAARRLLSQHPPHSKKRVRERGEEEAGGGAGVASPPVPVLAGLSVSGKCAAICRAQGDERNEMLVRLARDAPSELEGLLENVGAECAELLTCAWEEADAKGDASATAQETVYESLFGALPDGGERARAALMAAKEEFARTACAAVLKTALGLDMVDRWGET